MPPALRFLACILPLLARPGVGMAAAIVPPHSVVIEAGAFDRTNTPVTFSWPHDSTAGTARAPDGQRLPVQITGGAAWMLVPALARNTSRRYELQPSSASSRRRSRPRTTVAPGAVVLSQGRQVVARFTTGRGELPRPEIPELYRRAGYVHPLKTPAGVVVTGDYPTNHIHHHGIWASWTRTRFEGRTPDFWNMGQGSGRVDVLGTDPEQPGDVFAGLRSRHAYVDLSTTPPGRALDESWEVRVLATPKSAAYHLLDVRIEQRCAGPKALILPKYHYGGFAYRGLAEWDGAARLRYLDSNGVTNRVTANESRVRWCWLGGAVQQRDRGTTLAGVAFLAHPTNFRAPEPVRVHPTEPYFCFAPSQLGDWSIEPGSVHRMTYRLVILDGSPDAAELDRLWNDFAQPPVARVE